MSLAKIGEKKACGIIFQALNFINRSVTIALNSTFKHVDKTFGVFFSVNRIEVLRKDWMFKLIGSEKFRLPNGDCCPSGAKESCEKAASCEISIEPLGSFSYQYSLTVGGKPFKTFIEKQVGSRAVLFYLFIS